MVYTKTNWQNGSSPYLNATNLNKIEQGIDDAHADLENTPTGDTSNPQDKYRWTYDASSGGWVASPVRWEEIEGKPEEYPPAAHSHPLQSLPYVFVRKGADQSIASSGHVQITFQNIVSDNGGHYDPVYNRLLPQTAGLWLLEAGFRLDPSAAGAYGELIIYKNNAQFASLDFANMSRAGTYVFVGSKVVDAVVGDHYKVYVAQNASSTPTIRNDAQAFLSATYMGPKA